MTSVEYEWMLIAKEKANVDMMSDETSATDLKESRDGGSREETRGRWSNIYAIEANNIDAVVRMVLDGGRGGRGSLLLLC